MAAKTPAHRPARTRATSATIPSTLWATGPVSINPAEPWPPRILARAVLEYSRPRGRVLLISGTPAAKALVGELDRVPVTGEPRIADTDLVVVTALPPDAAGLHTRTSVEAAAERLRTGGLLVVLTRCSHDSTGRLHDISSSIVTEAQHCDLLYLQHLIAAPIRGVGVVTTPTDPASTEPRGRSDIVHTDVLVFLQPHDLTTTA